MSQNNWNVRFALTASILAVFIVVAGLWTMNLSLGHSKGLYRAEAQNYSQQYPADTDDRIARCPPVPTDRLKACVEEAIADSHDAQRGEHDLNAQREMADWAFWLLIISIFTTSISAFGLWALLKTIWQGREANEIAREAMARQSRAWIGLEITKINYLKAGHSTFTLSFEIRMKNIGNSPAKYLSFQSDLFRNLDLIESDNPSFINNFRNKFLSRPKEYLSVDLLPGEDFTNRIEIEVKKELVALEVGKPSDFFCIGVIVGAKYYTDFSPGEVRQTLRIWQLGGISAEGEPIIKMFDGDADLRGHELSLPPATKNFWQTT